MKTNKYLKGECSIKVSSSDKKRLKELKDVLSEEEGLNTYKETIEFLLDYYFITNDKMVRRGVFNVNK